MLVVIGLCEGYCIFYFMLFVWFIVVSVLLLFNLYCFILFNNIFLKNSWLRFFGYLFSFECVVG